MRATAGSDAIRYEPDEQPSLPIAVGAGIQATLVNIDAVVLAVVVVFRVAGGFEGYLPWAIFAGLVACGISTVLQTLNICRVGAGHILIIAPSGAYVAVCVVALLDGGPATMASLIVLSSLLQFFLSSRLSWLRRMFTPTVSGTVIMLIAVAVMPFIFDLLNEIPEGVSPGAASVAAIATLIAIAVMYTRAPAGWRIWSPLAGIVLGCAVSVPLGLYDIQAVLDAPWIGAPFGSWGGLDLSLRTSFWALLPAFFIATLVSSVQTISDSVLIQQVSRRRPRATDFRLAQGALTAVGISNVLSGLLGTLPNSTNSTSVALVQLTGVASRHVGIVVGTLFVVLAFLPKVTVLLVAIPAPVIAAYITILLSLLFVQGMRMIVQDGVDHRKATVVGLAFWLGVGFQGQVIFPSLITGFWGVLLGNGMTAGATVAVLMTMFFNVTGPRRDSLRVPLDIGSLPKIDEFLRGLASRDGWDRASTERLAAAGDESLAVLLQLAATSPENGERRLTIYAQRGEGYFDLDLVTALEGENVEDHLAYLGNLPPEPDEHEVSFRLLMHHASSVRHQKYHGIDVVTVRIENTR